MTFEEARMNASAALGNGKNYALFRTGTPTNGPKCQKEQKGVFYDFGRTGALRKIKTDENGATIISLANITKEEACFNDWGWCSPCPIDMGL